MVQVRITQWMNRNIVQLFAMIRQENTLKRWYYDLIRINDFPRRNVTWQRAD